MFIFMSGKKDNKKEKLKSLKKADERLKKEKKGVKKTKRKRGSGKKIAVGTAAAAVCILAAGYFGHYYRYGCIL